MGSERKLLGGGRDWEGRMIGLSVCVGGGGGGMGRERVPKQRVEKGY